MQDSTSRESHVAKTNMFSVQIGRLFFLSHTRQMGLRWQFRPALGAAAGLAVGLPLLITDTGPAGVAIAIIVVAGLLTAVFLLLVWLMPPHVPSLTRPGLGTERLFQHVGFRDHEIELTEATVAELGDEMFPRPGQRFSLRVFYPCDMAAAAAKQKYFGRADSIALSKVAGVPLPSVVYSHLAEIGIDAAENAALHPDALDLPVMMLSHGLSAIPGLYWAVIASFVRAGFVVAAPTHNDGSATRLGLSDGTELAYRTEADICRDAGHDAAEPQREAIDASMIHVRAHTHPRARTHTGDRKNHERGALWPAASTRCGAQRGP